MIASVDFGQLFELIWAAALAGLVVSGAFAAALVGFTRGAERRQSGSGGPATAWVLLALVATAIFIAAMVFGIEVIVSK
jgi:hypothetical protein